MNENFAKGITWNLADLYPSIDSPKIEEDLKTAEDKSLKFNRNYKSRLESLSKNESLAKDFPLKELIHDYEIIATLLTKPSVFAYLSFAGNTNDPKIGAFLQKIQTRITDIQSHLVFFEVMWNKLPAKTVEALISLPGMSNYRHYFEKLRTFAPFTLSEAEENILSLKANTGSRAFSRLFDEISNNIQFFMEVDGKKVKRNKAELLSLSHSPVRKERLEASKSLAEGLRNNSHVTTYIYNMILADHRSNLKLRKHQHPMESMNLSNEIDLDNVFNLIGSVKKAYPIAWRYYRLKRKLLGLDKLYDYDRYAPILENETRLNFSECREIVLSGYHQFSEEAGKIVEQFFSKRWIDAEIREGKHGGGFCAQTTPDLHPYILVNYTGTLRDVMTVAHELGHGLHQYTAAKKVGILESDAPLTMAETASVFGEMLIFEKILENVKDPRERLALICGKIDDNFATVFRQIVLTDFEKLAHEEGLKSGELDSEKLSDFWIQANAEFYGDSVVLTEDYRQGWKYIPHFVHTPFYCYAYSFAQLFVLALFQKYKEDKKDFVPKYLEVLSLGGSKKPEELARTFGLDLRSPDFWHSGLKLLDLLVGEAEKLSESFSLNSARS